MSLQLNRGLNGYNTAVARNYAAMEMRSLEPGDSYAWSVTGRRCGALGFTRIFAGGPIQARITRPPEQAQQRNMILAFVEDGAFEVEQAGRSSTCAAQSMLLMNATLPLEARQSGAASLFSLIIPADFLRMRIPQVDAACTTVQSARSGTGAVLRDLLQSSWRERDALDELEGRVLAGTFASLIDCVFVRGEPALPGADRAAALRERIAAVIESELPNPDLGPALIAERLGLSPSYLFAIAQKLNLSLRQTIINRRLDVCREVLADAGRARRTITEIAIGWGFQDSAHFSRRFSQRFGMTPQQYRRLAAGSLGGNCGKPAS